MHAGCLRVAFFVGTEMDPRERYNDPEMEFRTAWRGMALGLWTALPGIIQSFDASAVTAAVQPAIQQAFSAEDGTKTTKSLPVLTDVPVVFPRGGGHTLTFPIAAGDECLLVFSCRPIEAWWQSGGVQKAGDNRSHALSDAIAIVGPFSQTTKIGSVSTSTAQLRSDDGSTMIELNGPGKIVRIVAPAGVIAETPTLTVTGVIAVQNAQGASVASTIAGTLKTTTGDIISESGDVQATGISLKSHVHSGVTTGGSQTGGPVSS